MIRENVKTNMDIISAFAEGKTIQYKADTGSWHDLTENEGLPMGTLEEEPNNFRIKPESEYRPFANAEECWVEMCKHHPFGWVKTKSDTHRLIVLIDEDRLMMGAQNIECSYQYLFNKGFTFVDGLPFGVKVEE